MLYRVSRERTFTPVFIKTVPSRLLRSVVAAQTRLRQVSKVKGCAVSATLLYMSSARLVCTQRGVGKWAVLVTSTPCMLMFPGQRTSTWLGRLSGLDCPLSNEINKT